MRTRLLLLFLLILLIFQAGFYYSNRGVLPELNDSRFWTDYENNPHFSKWTLSESITGYISDINILNEGSDLSLTITDETSYSVDIVSSMEISSFFKLEYSKINDTISDLGLVEGIAPIPVLDNLEIYHPEEIPVNEFLEHSLKDSVKINLDRKFINSNLYQNTFTVFI